jgi:hypothetical protein
MARNPDLSEAILLGPQSALSRPPIFSRELQLDAKQTSLGNARNVEKGGLRTFTGNPRRPKFALCDLS